MVQSIDAAVNHVNVGNGFTRSRSNTTGSNAPPPQHDSMDYHAEQQKAMYTAQRAVQHSNQVIQQQRYEQAPPSQEMARSRSHQHHPQGLPTPPNSHDPSENQHITSPHVPAPNIAPREVAGPRPRRREKNEMSKEEVVARLRTICTPGDPTKLYRDLQTIGKGASGAVYTAYELGTNKCVAIKQMNLEQQPKKDLIMNEIVVMKGSKHKNIVNFLDSYLLRGDLWVIMEYMEGGSLTDVVTFNLMTEAQIAAVCKEVWLPLAQYYKTIR